MAVIQETNDDVPQQNHKEVVVNTNIAESEAEESEVDEEHEENSEEGNILDNDRRCVYVCVFMLFMVLYNKKKKASWMNILMMQR